MPKLKFNPYFTLSLIAPTEEEELPFVLGERLFFNLRLYLTTDITREIAVQFHGEPYENINPRSAAWFTPAEMVYSEGFAGCWVERATDVSRHLIELVGEETDCIVEAVLTADEPEMEFPVEVLTQVIRVPFEVYKVWPSFTEQGPIFEIVPAGEKHGSLIVAEVEVVEER